MSAPPPDPTLEELGFSDRVRALFAPFAEVGLTPARVLRADRGSVLAATEAGPVRAEPSASMRKEAVSGADLPAAGDWVALSRPPGHDIAIIEGVLPRSSAFVRGDPGKAADSQVLAANIDTVFVVHSLAEEPNLRRIERELALAWESGAVPVVVLAKADLSKDPEADRAAVEAIAAGVDVHVTSAETGEGVDALLAYTEGDRTVAFLGPSGVGKSTLINRLLGEDRQAVAEVRVSDGKGRHTTVSRELIPLPNGGVLVDTPGLRAVAMVEAEDGLAAAFPEIVELGSRCRFRDCAHEAEPGCAVLAAVESGELERTRFESWRKLRIESHSAAVRADARLSAEDRRKGKAIAKAARDFFKQHGS